MGSRSSGPAGIVSRAFLVRTVLTIHNLGYQGLFPHHGVCWGWTRICLQPAISSLYSQINFLKARSCLPSAHHGELTYSREIQTSGNSASGSRCLKTRSQSGGHLNSAPATNLEPQVESVHRMNSARNLSGKEAAGGLHARSDQGRPESRCLGAVSRLVSEGDSMLQGILGRLLAEGVQLVILGAAHRNIRFLPAGAHGIRKLECACIRGCSGTRLEAEPTCF